jgi:hypothetical protein
MKPTDFEQPGNAQNRPSVEFGDGTGGARKRADSSLMKKSCQNCQVVFMAKSCLEEFCSVDCRSNHFFFAEQPKKKQQPNALGLGHQFPKFNDLFALK